MRELFLKVDRTGRRLKKYTWFLALVIAVGGLYIPKLGLLLIPIMVSLVGISLFRGKYWCGNLCPHAGLFDYLLLPLARNGAIPRFLRSRPWRVLFFGFFMGMFSVRVWHAFQSWGQYDFLDKLGAVFAANYLLPTLIGIGLALTVNSRAWCSFCPMGTIQEIFYFLGKKLGLTKNADRLVTISAADACRECGRCAQVCPMQLRPFENFDQRQFSDVACIKCAVCTEHCPWKLLSMDRPITSVKTTDEQAA